MGKSFFSFRDIFDFLGCAENPGSIKPLKQNANARKSSCMRFEVSPGEQSYLYRQSRLNSNSVFAHFTSGFLLHTVAAEELWFRVSLLDSRFLFYFFERLNNKNKLPTNRNCLESTLQGQMKGIKKVKS